MSFEEDLLKRRIDVTAFAAGDPERFAEWQLMYSQMHPNSFYARVKMVLNDIRRRFWLAEAIKAPAAISEAPAKPAVARRAAIPGTSKPVTEPISPDIPETPAPAASPVKGRAVFRKPSAPVNPEVENIAAPATENISLTKEEPETPVTPIPARPRPVFRKPVSQTESNISDNPGEVTEQKGSNDILPVHTNPEPEAEKPTPRPRPIFKKPASTIPSATSPPETVLVKSEENIATGETTTTGENTTLPEADNIPAAKPPRPRPVFKRPTASTENVAPVPENIPPVIQILPVAEIKEPEMAKTEEIPEQELPKPPRPRPVFKRPSKPESEG